MDIKFDCGHTVAHGSSYDVVMKLHEMMHSLGGKTNCHDCRLKDPEFQEFLKKAGF